MTSQTKSASARLYSISYSKIILKLEILLVLIIFISQLMVSDDLWLLPSLFVSGLICFIYFSSYSIITQFPQGLVFEFRTAPDRLIWYDSAGESSFLLQDMDVRITRWFVLLKLENSSGPRYRVLIKDSFIDMSDYTSFRRYLLLKNLVLNKRDDE